MFEEDDSSLSKIYQDCKSGRLLCGDCKAMLASRVRKYVEDHQERRMKAKERITEFLVEDEEDHIKKKG